MAGLVPGMTAAAESAFTSVQKRRAACGWQAAQV